jgi:hypothetical protein
MYNPNTMFSSPATSTSTSAGFCYPSIFDGESSLNFSMDEDLLKFPLDVDDLDLEDLENDDILPLNRSLFMVEPPQIVSSPAAFVASPVSVFCMPDKTASSSFSSAPDSLISLVKSGKKKQQQQQKEQQESASASADEAPMKRRRRPNPKKVMAPLPEDFQPNSYSVLCGKGKDNFSAPGNCRFRITVQMFLQEYIDAKDSQTEKSIIVKKVMKILQDACPVGAFVTLKDGQWYEVDQRTAREKVGAFFRDCLAEHYRSSAKSKVAMRKMKREFGRQLDEAINLSPL